MLARNGCGVVCGAGCSVRRSACGYNYAETDCVRPGCRGQERERRSIHPGPRRGFHVPHTRVTAGFGCPLYPETTRCSADRSDPSGRRAPPLPGPGPIAPVHIHLPEAVYYEGHRQGSLASPARPSPRPGIPGWNKDSLGHTPRAPHPADQEPAAHTGRETGIEHSPGATARPTSPHLLSSSSLVDVRPRVARRSSP